MSTAAAPSTPDWWGPMGFLKHFIFILYFKLGDHGLVPKHQASVYNILSQTTAMIGYAIGLRWMLMAVRL